MTVRQMVSAGPHDLASFIPYEIISDPVAHSVRWISSEVLSLPEPFLYQSVDRFLTENPKAQTFTTPLDALIARSGETLAEPSLFILHVTHCGSTLLANLMRAINNSLVVSEPEPVNVLLSPPAFTSSGQTRGRYLHGLIAALMRSRTPGTPGVIKLTSWNVLFAALLRDLFPSVPILFVVRDPTQVMQSQMFIASRWLRYKTEKPAWACEIFGWRMEELEAMSVETYCARVLGHFYEAMRGLRGSEKVFILDYKDISANSLSHLLPRVLGRELSRQECNRLNHLIKFDSKSPGLKTRYTGSLVCRSSPPPANLIRAAERWALGPYRALAQ